MPAAFPPAGSSTLEKGDARPGIWVLSHGIHPDKGFENPRQRKDFEPFFIALVGLPNPMPRRRMPPGMDGAPSSHVGVPPRVRSGRGGAREKGRCTVRPPVRRHGDGSKLAPPFVACAGSRGAERMNEFGPIVGTRTHLARHGRTRVRSVSSCTPTGRWTAFESLMHGRHGNRVVDGKGKIRRRTTKPKLGRRRTSASATSPEEPLVRTPWMARFAPIAPIPCLPSFHPCKSWFAILAPRRSRDPCPSQSRTMNRWPSPHVIGHGFPYPASVSRRGGSPLRRKIPHRRRRRRSPRQIDGPEESAPKERDRTNGPTVDRARRPEGMIVDLEGRIK